MGRGLEGWRSGKGVPGGSEEEEVADRRVTGGC